MADDDRAFQSLTQPLAWLVMSMTSFARRGFRLHSLIGFADGAQIEAPGIDTGHDHAGFNQRGGLAQDLAMVGAALPAQQRQQSEDTGIGGRAERQRPERMFAPAKTAHYMAEAADGLERGVEGGAADRVVDEVEASPIGMLCNVLFDRCRSVIDRRRAEPRDESQVDARACREHYVAPRAVRES